VLTLKVTLDSRRRTRNPKSKLKVSGCGLLSFGFRFGFPEFLKCGHRGFLATVSELFRVDRARDDVVVVSWRSVRQLEASARTRTRGGCAISRGGAWIRPTLRLRTSLVCSQIGGVGHRIATLIADGRAADRRDARHWRIIVIGRRSNGAGAAVGFVHRRVTRCRKRLSIARCESVRASGRGVCARRAA